MSIFFHCAKALLATGALSAILAFTPLLARADEFSAPQKTAIEKIVRDYLISKPEVLREAIGELEKRARAEEATQRAAALKSLSATLLDPKNQTALGNPDGKITLVEFFDYNCGYCKKAMADLAKLIKENPDLRVVLKDFPVLGPASVEAAQVAVAAQNQIKGAKYWDFHQKLLMTRGQIGKAQAIETAKEFGANGDQLEKDAQSAQVTARISETMNAGDQLSLTGTPSWILGDDVIVGAVGYDELRGKLDNMRKCGKVVCS